MTPRPLTNGKLQYKTPPSPLPPGVRIVSRTDQRRGASRHTVRQNMATSVIAQGVRRLLKGIQSRSFLPPARVGAGIIAPAFPCIRQRLMSCDDLAASSRAARREIIYTDGLDRIGDGKRIGDAVRRFVRRRFTNMMMRQRRRTSSDTRASVAYTHGYKK